MATITATLLTASEPQPVQVVIDDIPSGGTYVVSGAAGDFTWTVNAGEGVSVGEQVVLIDLQAPINTPIEYTVTVNGVPTTADPMTVTVDGEFLLQTLTGVVAIPLTVEDGDFAREYTPRQNLFSIPGRPRPVVRYDTLSDASGTLRLTTTREQTKELLAVLESGAPIVYRQTGIRDLPLVETVAVTGLKSTSAIDDLRQWDLSYTVVDNPEPGVPSVVFTWDLFDEIHAGSTWTQFDTDWAGRTWDEFDTEDWSQYA